MPNFGCNIWKLRGTQTNCSRIIGAAPEHTSRTAAVGTTNARCVFKRPFTWTTRQVCTTLNHADWIFTGSRHCLDLSVQYAACATQALVLDLGHDQRSISYAGSPANSNTPARSPFKLNREIKRRAVMDMCATQSVVPKETLHSREQRRSIAHMVATSAIGSRNSRKRRRKVRPHCNAG